MKKIPIDGIDYSNHEIGVHMEIDTTEQDLLVQMEQIHTQLNAFVDSKLGCGGISAPEQPSAPFPQAAPAPLPPTLNPILNEVLAKVPTVQNFSDLNLLWAEYQPKFKDAADQKTLHDAFARRQAELKGAGNGTRP